MASPGYRFQDAKGKLTPQESRAFLSSASKKAGEQAIRLAKFWFLDTIYIYNYSKNM